LDAQPEKVFSAKIRLKLFPPRVAPSSNSPVYGLRPVVLYIKKILSATHSAYPERVSVDEVIRRQGSCVSASCEIFVGRGSFSLEIGCWELAVNA